MPRIRQSATGTNFVTGSGFIVRSPRILLNELDDNPGSYPTVSRTGDPNRAGNQSVSFDDGSTIDFLSNGNPVFPTMLPRNSRFITQSVDIIGEQSDINVSLPIRSFQHPAHLHYSPAEEVGPFNENRSIPATDFFLSGTDPDILPGFTSPIRSKIAIEIDITPQSDTMVMRNVDRRTVLEGGASIGDHTGFLYYNFGRKEWEQIGLRDPATGEASYFDFAVNNSTSFRSGTYPSQFHSSPGLPYVEKATFATLTKEEVGYAKIGSPTVILGAPSLPLYHATQSQALKMSDYIQHPFLLEAVHFEFQEINAQRIQGNVRSDIAGDPLVSGFTSWPQLVASGAVKDIDNYVFFAYRQSRSNRVVDSTSDVSSSIRNLIFSGSLCFWNSSSLGTGGQASLLHSPAFNHEFGLPYNDSYAVGQFTGSVNLNLKPAVCSPFFGGLTAVLKTIATTAAYPSSPTTYDYDCWPGGTSNRDLPQNTITTNFNILETSELASKYSRYDARSARTLGGEITAPSQVGYFGIQVSLNDSYSNSSPYLLLPSDEIIFGLEAGVGIYQQQQSFSALTGSFLRIKSKPCKVTLYGSMIKDGSEHLHSLNQNLTSDSIHEIVGAEPVLDQFQIEPVSSYYGSYLDDIVTGSLATLNSDGFTFTVSDESSSRGITSRVSLGQAGLTGSLQRFLNVRDSSELIYDSCLPDYFDVMEFNAEDSEYKYRGDAVIRYDADADGAYETGADFASSIKQFPFEGNPRRRTQKTAALVSVADAGVNDIMSDPADFTGVTLDSLKTVFLTRYAFLSQAPSITLPDYTDNFSPISSKSSTDISSNLISSYFFTSSADSVLYDLSGQGNNLALNPNFGAGAHPLPSESTLVPVGNILGDGSLRFQLASSVAQVRVVADTTGISDHQMADATNDIPFTISTTFRTISTAEQILVERANRNAGLPPYEADYRLFISGTDQKIEFRIFDSSNPTHYKGVKASGLLSVIDQNEWYNVTVTYNGDKSETAGVNCMKIYINGTERTVSEASDSPSGSRMYTDAGSRLWIAAGGGSSTSEPLSTNEFNGYIHSTHIWKNRVLTSDEIRSLSDAELLGVSNGYIKHRAAFGLKNYSGPLRVGTYRYGISNINQEHSGLTISPVRFGHVRDILEQRKDTVFAGSIPPIACSFLSGSTRVDPNLTFSQNISSFATSSMPYFDDGIPRNRPDNPDEAFTI